MTKIEIHFDGGCQPNPGRRYGSFEVLLNGRSVKKVSRMNLGHGTNNEAEFEALLAALDWTESALSDGGFNSSDHTVEVFTDSTIVKNRITQRNRTHKTEPQGRMLALANRCLRYLVRFREFKIQWRGRDANVSRFGH